MNKKIGRPKTPPEEKLIHSFQVSLNDEEMRFVLEQKGVMSKSAMGRLGIQYLMFNYEEGKRRDAALEESKGAETTISE